MSQELEVTVKIPEEYIVIKREDYDDLKRKDNQGKYANFDWMSERVSMSADSIKDKILLPYRDELESEYVKYGKKGSPYIFNVSKMNEWLEENFERVWG